MSKGLFRAGCAAVVSIAAVPAMAAPKPPAQVFTELVRCRAITEAATRLACFDTVAAKMETAQASGDLLVADRAQVRESKRALFGFGSIRLPIFGDGKDDADMPTEITSAIVAVRPAGYQMWDYKLENGMRWRQTISDDTLPRVGQIATVKSGALGSYTLKAGKQRAVKVVRTE